MHDHAAGVTPVVFRQQNQALASFINTLLDF
jgi:hypothetical protein